MPSTYPPKEIALFLSSEALATHGISPEVYQQNTSILRSIGAIATRLSHDVLGLQPIGSRTHGVSQLTSDIDVNTVTFDTIKHYATCNAVWKKLGKKYPGLVVDTTAAADINGIDEPIPRNAQKFIRWTEEQTLQVTSLFGASIPASPSLTLTGMAAMEVFAAATDERQAAARWNTVRDWHAHVYLGNMTHVQQKLYERLTDYSPAEIDESITPELLHERYDRFGLPTNMREYLNTLRHWAHENQRALQTLPAYALYQEVMQELQPVKAEPPHL